MKLLFTVLVLLIFGQLSAQSENEKTTYAIEFPIECQIMAFENIETKTMVKGWVEFEINKKDPPYLWLVMTDTSRTLLLLIPSDHNYIQAKYEYADLVLPYQSKLP